MANRDIIPKRKKIILKYCCKNLNDINKPPSIKGKILFITMEVASHTPRFFKAFSFDFINIIARVNSPMKLRVSFINGGRL